MTTVAIGEKYVEMLRSFGKLEDAVNLALQRYTIEQITFKMADLKHRDSAYQAKYGMSYPAFVQRISVDETFVNQVETTICKTWEMDLAEWEFCHKGIQDWTRKLQTILLT